ncbi:MAG: OmpA family protein [Methylobacter sp.]|uniref:OmpA family protein n=1 Tax=Methylobacter sp. TaxID=2051955 RepID=UPI0027303F67|nr:OmpA family protein [Methylobacter sp.]MDP1665047.1 OmpA family protein [Methylobacter sp.]
MRFIIIGLSIIFFTLSTIITFKALELPDQKVSYQDHQKDTTSELNNVIKKLTEDQDTNKAIVADLQATVAQLEDKLKVKEEVPESIKTTDAENRPRTLAVFGGGTFRSGKTVLNDGDLSTIENFVGEISASQGSRVIIEGHTDNIPTGKQHVDNMDLSLRRARAIANILVSHGVSSDRISAIGYGDAHPIDSNDTEEGRAKNRRVEVKLMPKEPTEGKS